MLFRSVTLLPNQKLTIVKESTEIDPVNDTADDELAAIQEITPNSGIIRHDNIDPLPDISWKDNEWVIYRESLENLAVKLERRFDIKIIFNDDHLKSLRYNGTLPDESLEQVLNVMKMVSPIKYTIRGKTVIFSEHR